MPTKKIAEFIENDDITDVWDTGPIPDAEPDNDASVKADALAEALKADPEAFINVSRQRAGGNSPMEFVCRYPADKFDLGQLQEELRQTYGGGDYRIMLYAKGRLKANKLVSIASPSTASTPRQASATNDMVGLAQVMFEKMEEQNRMFMEAITQLRSGTDSRKAMLDEMLLYKQLFDNNHAPADPIQQMKEVLALQTELRASLPSPTPNNDDTEENWSGLLDKVGDIVLNAQKSPSKEGNKVHPMLKMGLQQLVNAAMKNGDPGNYAGLVIDNFSGIAQQINAPDLFAKLSAIEPRLGEHKAWFDLLVEHIKAQLGQPSSVSDLYTPDNEMTQSSETIDHHD